MKNLARGKSLFSRVFCLILCVAVLGSGCGTSDAKRLKESRDDYVKGDFAGAETQLFTPEVFKNQQNRLEHYYFLASIAMSEAQFEKAIYFLNRARDLANSLRSSDGTFHWFTSDYTSNPLEYSYIHYMLVMSYSLLAQAGQTPAWSMPEIKDDKGNIAVQAQNNPARTYSPREVADFRAKAHSELLAWDSFLETMKRTYPDKNYYKEDLWARLLASYVHGLSTEGNERRTSELLTNDATTIFQKDFMQYPSAKTNQSAIEDLIARLKKRAQGPQNNDSLFVVEAGVMPQMKTKRFVIGLSTIFSGIKDPGLRRQMEIIGLQVLLSEAPEFGLIAAGGAVAGAVSSGDDDDGPPHYFSEAVDRSFGFEVRFATMPFPASDTHVKLTLTPPGQTSKEYALPIVAPLQEMVATELKNRESGETFSRAMKIGAQYLAILIPAVQAYRAAGRKNNVFQKIGILAGYFIAKKAIDNANNPDLRSWSTLPDLIAANLITATPGSYDAKVTIQNEFGVDERTLGRITLGEPNALILRQRIGDVPILNRTTSQVKHTFR